MCTTQASLCVLILFGLVIFLVAPILFICEFHFCCTLSFICEVSYSVWTDAYGTEIAAGFY